MHLPSVSMALRGALVLGVSMAVTACGGGDGGGRDGAAPSGIGTDPPSPAPASALSPAALLGQKIFFGRFLVNATEPGSDAGYVGNVNSAEIPYNRPLGGTPALSPDEINDLIAFLCTLTDGYDPNNPNAQVLPAQCQSAAAP